MLHKAEWMGHPMRLELTRVGLLIKAVNRYTNRDALAGAVEYTNEWSIENILTSFHSTDEYVMLQVYFWLLLLWLIAFFANFKKNIKKKICSYSKLFSTLLSELGL